MADTIPITGYVQTPTVPAATVPGTFCQLWQCGFVYNIVNLAECVDRLLQVLHQDSQQSKSVVFILGSKVLFLEVRSKQADSITKIYIYVFTMCTGRYHILRFVSLHVGILSLMKYTGPSCSSLQQPLPPSLLLPPFKKEKEVNIYGSLTCVTTQPALSPPGHYNYSVVVWDPVYWVRILYLGHQVLPLCLGHILPTTLYKLQLILLFSS